MASKLKLVCVILIASFVSSFSMEDTALNQLYYSGHMGFAKLLEYANLEEELDEQINEHKFLTILAPTDKFLLKNLSPVLLSWLKMDKNVLILRQVLTSHVIVGELSPDKTSVYENSILGTSLEINKFNGLLSVEGIPIDLKNSISTNNFVIYSIDGLIIKDDVNVKLHSFLSNIEKEQNDQGIRLFARHDYSKLEIISPAQSPGPSDSAGATPSPSDISPTSSNSSPPPSSSPSLSSSPSESPSSSKAPSSGETILDQVIATLNASGNYQTLLKYFLEIDRLVLESIFSENVTFLAPSDYAFGVLSPTIFQYLQNSSRIDEVIDFHILPSYVTSTGFGSGSGSTDVIKSGSVTRYEYVTVFQGYKMNVTVYEGGKVFFGSNNATISEADMLVTGKTSLSGLDQVLVPEDFIVRANAIAKSDGCFKHVGMLNGFSFWAVIALFILKF